MEWSERIGRYGELMFAAEAISRGLTVLEPNGVHGYDFVIEHKGKFTKVQVKTTSVKNEGRRYRWTLKTKDYGADVYALYVTDTNMFFIIDTRNMVIKNKSVTISISKMQNYNMNNWDIFKNKRR